MIGTGHHGYTPSRNTDLYPLFIASGPAFKRGVVSGPIKIVDLYPLMCEVLGIEPAPNNGSLERVQHLLIDQPESSTSRSTISLISGEMPCDEPRCEKTDLQGLPTRSDTNRAVQPKKVPRGLKFRI